MLATHSLTLLAMILFVAACFVICSAMKTASYLNSHNYMIKYTNLQMCQTHTVSSSPPPSFISLSSEQKHWIKVPLKTDPKTVFFPPVSFGPSGRLVDLLVVGAPWWPSVDYALCTARSGASEKHQHTKP